MKRLFFILASAVLVFSMTSCTITLVDPNDTDTSETPDADVEDQKDPEASESEPDIENEPVINSEKITMEEFEQIKTGMTYEEVVAIIGGTGELSSEVNLGMGDEYITQIYVWYGEGAFSIGNANITFQGGKVVAKAQFGLD